MTRCSRGFALLLGMTLATGAFGPAAAQDDVITADTAFGGFRAALADALDATRDQLALVLRWVEDPDWYLVQTPDSGVVGVRRSALADHAALLADPAFAAIVDVLDDPVHAWDEGFTMSLGLIGDEGGDPVAAAERLTSSLSQPTEQKKSMLRIERQGLRAERERLTDAIGAFDTIATGLGLGSAPVAADDAADDEDASPDGPGGPLALASAFLDELIADREAVEARISDCRAAIAEEAVVALGERDGLPGVVTFDLSSLPDYVDFPSYLRDHVEAWDHIDDIFGPDIAQLQPLRAAMLRFSLWQDWPPDMRAAARTEVRRGSTTEEDRAVCRPLLGLLRPERDRLDTAIAALDGYVASATPEPAPELTS